MQTQGLFLVLAAIPNILIGVFILMRNMQDKVNVSFSTLAFAVSAWSLGLAAYIFTSDTEVAYRWAQFYYLAAALIALAFVYFSHFYVTTGRIVTRTHVLLAVPYALLSAAIILRPEFLMTDIATRSWGKEIILEPYGYLIYTVIFSTYVFFGFAEILKGLLKVKGVKKVNLQYILGGFLIAFALGAAFNLILPFFGNYEYIWAGPLFTIAYVGLISYAIVRHGLFDIRLAAVRAVAYTLSLGSLSLAYFILAYFASITFFESDVTTGVSFSPVNIGLALMMAFTFQPVKKFFDKVTDSIFFRDRYDSDEFIAGMGATLTSTTQLRILLQRSSNLIESTLKASHTTFIVLRDDTAPAVSSTSSRPYTVKDIHPLMELVDGSDDILDVEKMLGRSDLSGQSRRTLRALHERKIALVLPLMLAKGPLGLLLVGEHRSGYFSKRDLRVLEAVSDELVVAIQNARSLQELRDLNQNLELKIKEATTELLSSNNKLKRLDEAKDEFISMASHQLRTPLTSVKGYISMMLDGDVGKITPDQRKVLEQAFDSSQRMVFLIGDFLNVSRLQTGKFMLEPGRIEFTQLVAEEVDQLRDTAKMRQMTLEYARPSQKIESMADENKLRQVMMNFMDNAIYYSTPGTTIKVQLLRDGDYVTFKVRDTGIGVPKSEQAKLFSKFFRATNARKQRPDGTGIGLYMAKKVVVAHGGSVLFESKEGKGSTFGFRLPLKH